MKTYRLDPGLQQEAKELTTGDLVTEAWMAAVRHHEAFLAVPPLGSNMGADTQDLIHNEAWQIHREDLIHDFTFRRIPREIAEKIVDQCIIQLVDVHA